MKKEFWKRSRFWLVICLVLCLISGIGASAVTRNGGKVEAKKLTWTTAEGHTVSGMLYIPDNATAENPAPAVVTVHGWYNTNAFQDLFDIELVRRGCVVLSPDMIGHGDSDITDWDHIYDDASGINSAVELLGSLDCVDKSRIGLTGHSSGGDQSGAALPYDNARETPLISAILWQSSIWTDDTGVNQLEEIGARQAGVIATQYDEFFYGDVPREFINSEDAQAFLSFSGESPVASPESGKYYSTKVDGKDASRVIYAFGKTHPREHFSKESVGYALEFFDKALSFPNSIAYNKQIWPLATFFKTIGLLAWIFVFITFALSMLGTEFFGKLRTAGDDKEPFAHPTNVSGKAWFWVPLLGVSLLNGGLFVFIQHKLIQKPSITNIWPQTSSLGIAVYVLVSAVISLIVFAIYYKTYGKNHGYNLKERGTLISLDVLGRTILLALLTIFVGFTVLFAIEYFFHTDFRFYLIAARSFNVDLFLVALRFMPFFIIGQCISSVVINGPFNTTLLSSKWKYGNLVLVAFFNALGMLILWGIQYGNFYRTGTRMFNGTLGILICFIWMVPLIFNTVAASVISRTIYRRTGNPYIGGIINGIMITFIQCASTTTVLVSMASNSYLPM